MINGWLNQIEAAQNTRRNYITALAEYTNFIGLTPEQTIDTAEKEIVDGVLMRKRTIKTYMIGFREMLKQRGLAPKTIHNHIAGVKSFYRSNDIDLPNLNQKKHTNAKPLKENDMRLTRDDVKDALAHANVRNRALILVMASSGLSQADLLELRVGDFKNGFDPQTGTTTLHVRRIKTDYDFITFLSPEACRAVDDWLELREIIPRKTTKGRIRFEKHHVRMDSDYLFTKEDIPEKYLETLDEDDRRLTPRGLMATMRRIGSKCGKETGKNQWSLIRAHNFRKFFNTTLLNAGADIFFVDYLMGHVIDSTHAAYFTADPEKLKARYLKYLPHLSIEDLEVKVVESAEYMELKRELEELKAADKKRGEETLELMDLIQREPRLFGILKAAAEKT